MQGNIDFTGSLSGSISGGGGGGSDVTITPTLETGTKIADYTIDDTPGVLYAPTPTSLTAQLPLSISENTISIDLSNYATQSDISDFVTGSELATVLEDYPTYTYTESRYTPLATFNAYTIAAESHFQRALTAGANITIDPTTDIISASGGTSWDYSTTEVNTGQKWIDGKQLYERTINCGELSSGTHNIETLTVEEVKFIKGFAENINDSSYIRPLPFAADSSNSIRVDISNNVLRIITYASWSGYRAYLTIQYTKSSE